MNMLRSILLDSPIPRIDARDGLVARARADAAAARSVDPTLAAVFGVAGITRSATVNCVRFVDTDMFTSTELKTPEQRECERCGRREVWDPDDGWRLAAESTDSGEGERAIGDPHCIHEWDIDGTFSPYE